MFLVEKKAEQLAYSNRKRWINEMVLVYIAIDEYNLSFISVK